MSTESPKQIETCVETLTLGAGSTVIVISVESDLHPFNSSNTQYIVLPTVSGGV